MTSGNATARRSVTAREANRDVLRLAKQFGLPELEDSAPPSRSRRVSPVPRARGSSISIRNWPSDLFLPARAQGCVVSLAFNPRCIVLLFIGWDCGIDAVGEEYIRCSNGLIVSLASSPL